MNSIGIGIRVTCVTFNALTMDTSQGIYAGHIIAEYKGEMCVCWEPSWIPVKDAGKEMKRAWRVLGGKDGKRELNHRIPHRPDQASEEDDEDESFYALPQGASQMPRSAIFPQYELGQYNPNSADHVACSQTQLSQTDRNASSSNGHGSAHREVRADTEKGGFLVLPYCLGVLVDSGPQLCKILLSVDKKRS